VLVQVQAPDFEAATHYGAALGAGGGCFAGLRGALVEAGMQVRVHAELLVLDMSDVSAGSKFKGSSPHFLSVCLPVAAD
jgi:hypothetical protein